MPDESYESDKYDSLTENQAAFLRVYVKTASVTKAADEVGVHRTTHYDWLDSSEAYAVAFRACKPAMKNAILAPLIERLAEGWDEPVFQDGKIIGHKRKFDNTNAMKMLAKLSPDEYGEKVEIDASIEAMEPELMIRAMLGTVPKAEGSDD